MPLLSFNRRFTPLIKSGFKSHTLRRRRERPFAKGETLYLWQEQRHSSREFIGCSICCRVDACIVTLDSYRGAPTLAFEVNGEKWSRLEAESFAIRDGFSDMAEMIEYWLKDGADELFPFDGVIVYWNQPIMDRRTFARNVEKN